MLDAIRQLPTAHRILSYLLLSYGDTTVFAWTGGNGEVHEIIQGQSGAQGDALMPALFSTGMAGSLRHAQEQLLDGDTYLDDVYIVTSPEWARSAYGVVANVLRDKLGAKPTLEKTVCWNRAGGIAPPGIVAPGEEDVWRGGQSIEQSGIRVLGAPLSTDEFETRFGSDRADGTSDLPQS